MEETWITAAGECITAGLVGGFFLWIFAMLIL